MKKYIYKPAQNIQEAERMAADMGVRAFYTGLDLEIANTCNECIIAAFNSFPKIRKQINVIGNGQLINKALKKELEGIVDNPNSIVKRMNEDARSMLFPYALFSNKKEKIIRKYTGIYLNSNTLHDYSDVINYYNEQVFSGHSPSGLKDAGIKAIIEHEIGHIIDYCYNIHEDETVINLFNSANNVSEYATSNILEFIAECWSEYTNSKDPSNISKEVVCRIYAHIK